MGKTVRCEDGSIRACYAGTPIGCDPNGEVCDAIMGYETQIICSHDASKHFCNAGTRDCYDDSEKFCGAKKLGLAQQALIVKKAVVCYDGSIRACYADSR